MDEKLAQQLTDQELGHQPDAGISQTLEARFQQMEESQVQATELLLARMQHIDKKLDQVVRIVHDHVASSSSTMQKDDVTKQQPVIFQLPSSYVLSTPEVGRGHLPAAHLIRTQSPASMPKSGRILQRSNDAIYREHTRPRWCVWVP